MAITRAQQFKQMLREGGRIGLKGGADAATESFSKSAGSSRKGRPDPKGGFDLSGGKGPTFDGAPASDPDKDTRDKEKAKYNRQFTSKGIAPPGPNRRKRQNALNFVNRNISRYLKRFGSYYDPSKFNITKTGYPSFGFPNIYDIIDEELGARKDIKDILATGNKIPIGKSGLSYELSAVPDLDIDSIRELASTQTTMQGAPITGYQADALEDLKESIGKRDKLIKTGDTSDIYPDPPEPAPDDKGDPCLGPNPPAYCFIGANAPTTEEDTTPVRNLGGASARIGGSLFDFDEFAAEGGRIGAAEGGIMDLARQEMFFGGIAKGIKKGLKGISRTIKKVAKSPIGKIALAAAAGGYGFGLGPFKGIAGSGFLKGAGVKNFFLKEGAEKFALSNLSGKGIASIIGGASLLPLLMGPKEEDEFDIEEYYRQNALNPNAPLNMRIAGSQFAFAEGGDVEPVAKKTMPLLDMDGQEMDLRAEGGFVPIGRMEKADDVPARLSKNEFVFTADAVRNAGDGDVDKGAEVMYNMMKNLESGGDVSEESQGLSGAREMFQTSKRLEEVL